jgi:CheY-like chemotaxis protein
MDVSESKTKAVILGLEMSEMNGFEATALIRGDYRTSSVPVIIFTSYHDNLLERAKTSLLGATRFISKGEAAFPYLLDTLQELKILPSQSLGERSKNGQA